MESLHLVTSCIDNRFIWIEKRKHRIPIEISCNRNLVLLFWSLIMEITIEFQKKILVSCEKNIYLQAIRFLFIYFIYSLEIFGIEEI